MVTGGRTGARCISWLSGVNSNSPAVDISETGELIVDVTKGTYTSRHGGIMRADPAYPVPPVIETSWSISSCTFAGVIIAVFLCSAVQRKLTGYFTGVGGSCEVCARGDNVLDQTPGGRGEEEDLAAAVALCSKMEACRGEASLEALTDAAFDKDEGVRGQIAQSLHSLGCQNPEQVLGSCLEFLLKHSQLAQGHRTAILQCMERIVRDTIGLLGQPLAKRMIGLASEEMIKSGEAEVGWKEAASNLLVALGSRFSDEILEEVMRKLQPGSLPQFFVVQTLANLSVANVQGMVPYLPTTLQTMLPMLSLVKQDNMKWVFTSALGLFSKSILEYLSSVDRTTKPVLCKDVFSQEIYAAYKILFGNWLRNKDSKLRTAIVVALSYMVRLLPNDRIDDELPRFLTGVLALYKKRCEPFYVTQCLHNILETGVEMGSHVPEAQMDALLPQLHHQLCSPADPAGELGRKNHAEVLQCLVILLHVSVDGLVKFLLQKLSNSNERVRLGTLTALDHVIATSFKPLETKKALIVCGVKQALQDNDNRVKKMLAQVIGRMGEHGYLQLEGGYTLVEFLVLQCSLTPSENPSWLQLQEEEDVSDEELRRFCEGVLGSLVGLDAMDDVLWPFLLEFVTPVQYTNALSTVCRCLERVGAKRKREKEQRTALNYSERLGMPKPHTLLARLLAVSATPYAGQGRGLAALRLLRALSPNIHPEVVHLWDEELPQLIQSLAENQEDSLPQKLWEDKLFFFLSRTLETITDEKWTWQLSEEMTHHLHGYHSFPREKAFLYKCVGIVLGQTSNRDVIGNGLQEMLLSVQHAELLEREGLATGIGFCAMSHLDDTLAKLDEFVRMDIVKKTASFFNILKERLDGDMERVKSTLILCYGYVALYAPEGLILQRIELHILDHILSLSNTKVLGIKVETKDLMIKLTLIKAVTLIAKAIYANKGKHNFKFSRREELLSYMQDLIAGEPRAQLKTRVRQTAINACVHLVRLEPRLNEMESSELIRGCLEAVFSFLPLDADKQKDTRKLKEREVLHAETVAALHELLKEFLAQSLNSEGLEFIFKYVQEWMASVRDHERERAVGATLALLGFYRERFNAMHAGTFHNLGALAGHLVPRCADPSLPVRHAAVDGLHTLLCIQERYEGGASRRADGAAEHLHAIKARLQNPDCHALFRICCDVAQVLSGRLPRNQLPSLLFTLFEGLSDYHSTSASACSVVMNGLARRHGEALRDHVPDILGRLQTRVQSVSLEQIRFSITYFISLLTSQCMPGVLAHLLLQPLPYDKYTAGIWQSLAREAQLAQATMQCLLDKLNSYLSPGRKPQAAASETVAVVYALTAMVSNPESAEPVVSLYPRLFGTLVLYLSFLVSERVADSQGKSSSKRRKLGLQPSGAQPVNVWDSAVEALKLTLVRGGTEEVVTCLEDEVAWELMKSAEGHRRSTALLAQATGRHAARYLVGIIHFLEPALLHTHEHQRATAAAFFSELLAQPVIQELAVTDVLVRSLLRTLEDPSPSVHLLSVRGLGNLALGAPQKVPRYADQLLAAMVGGLDQRAELDDFVALEALSGLSKVLGQLAEEDVGPALTDVIAAVQPFFESERERLRAAAFAVFGSLLHFADGGPCDLFMERVHLSLVSLLLHVNDSSPEVVAACKAVLHLLGPHLCSDNIRAVFRAELLEEADTRYWDFIDELTRLIVSDFPDRAGLYLSSSVSFFKSVLPEIRGNAIVLAGFLMHHLPREHVEASADQNVCVAIIMMLHDVSPCVRAKAAKVLGLQRAF
ncbi:maestro heat-like repeat-containing protein family member 1 [Mobula hypostoma]|uniref:maestro heat-like repeat-containing protein family member 1 n=1 Tax=Mobula hypostoma TaxID=723540 RepID=UPI002FC2DDA5